MACTPEDTDEDWDLQFELSQAHHWGQEAGTAVLPTAYEDGFHSAPTRRRAQQMNDVIWFPARFPNRKWGYIDSKGNAVTRPLFESAGFFKDGFSYVVENGMLTVINAAFERFGRFPGARGMLEFSEGTLVYCRDEKYGLIDQDGSAILSPEFDMLLPTVDGKVVARREKYGIIDLHGVWQVPPMYWSIKSFETGASLTTAILCEGDAIVIRSSGAHLHTEEIQDGGRCHEGLLPVTFKSNDEIGWIDDSGRTVFRTDEFSGVGDAFYFRSIPVKLGELWGVSDTQGNIVVPPTHAYLGNLVEGRRAFQSVENKLWGFLDAEGHVVVEPVYGHVFDFRNGLARASIGRDRMFYLGRDGGIVWASDRQ